jgi:hypothetical protein
MMTRSTLGLTNARREAGATGPSVVWLLRSIVMVGLIGTEYGLVFLPLICAML